MKKLMIFLMVTIPLLVVLIVNFTIDVFLGDIYIPVERIEITPNSIDAKVGDKISLTYKVYPENATNKDIVLKSDNESVAIIDPQGNVEFLSYGSGYITASTPDGKYASCYYFATDDKVHRVVLSAESNELAIGSSMQLGVEILPSGALNRDVTFESDNEYVAEVDSNGRVTGKNLGSANIKVTTADGGKTDSILISVVKPVEKINVDQSQVICASPTYQVHYSIVPEDATNKKVNFNIDNNEVAEIDEMGLITFKKAGEFKLTITTASGNVSKEIQFIYTGGYAYQLNVNETVISAKMGDLPRYIDFNIEPLDCIEKVRFKSDNENIVKVDENGLLQFVGGGDTIVHVYINKNETEVIEQEVNVHIENPATDIVIENEIVTALPEIMLSPSSYPEDSTNKAFFYHSLTENVNVSADGLVTFLSQEAMTAQIEIHANSEDSDVKKVVKVTFTAGKATEFNLVSTELEILCDHTQTLNYVVKPANAQDKPTLEIVSSTPNVENDKVIEILSDGSIRALNGGSAVVKASMTLHNGETVSQNCTIKSIRLPSSISINLDLELYNQTYVSAEKVVQLSASVLPLDCSNKDIVWSVNDNDRAIISNNELIFNSEGVIELTARCGDVKQTISVNFSGSSPLTAEVGARINGEEKELPETIKADESFEVYIKSILPAKVQNKDIYLSLTNEASLSTTKHVLTINGTTVTATAGGKVTLVVNIANSVRLSYDITVIKDAEKIIVTPANTTVTSSVIQLNAEVLPQDASNKEVRFELRDRGAASLEDNVLTFKQDGVVRLRAYCIANESIVCNFYIEKIAKEVVKIPGNTSSMTVYKGAVLSFNLEGKTYTRFSLESKDQDVISVDGEYLRALKTGRSLVTCTLYNDSVKSEVISVDLNVIALVEQITLKNDLDFQDGEYIVGSEQINLDFEVLPTDAENKKLKFSLESDNGPDNSIAYMKGDSLCFIVPGVVNLIVNSEDGGISTKFRIRYTGGDAVAAVLNVENKLEMEIGQQITIDVSKWIPKDTTNKVITLRDISSLTDNAISIRGRNITAIAGGTGRVLVEISNGISKEIEINVIRRVSSIQIEDEILSANSVITLDAQPLPTSATNKVLLYSMEENNIASISENVLTFTKPGTVYVNISTTDGSKITKRVAVTSTMGFYSKLVLNADSKTLSKNDIFNLYVLQKYPTDATPSEIKYKILSSAAADGSDKEVISLNANGTITALYGGQATVRVFTEGYEGEEVYADCQVTVFVPVTGIDINFSRKLDLYQNAYLTSQNEIEFDFVIYPADASIRTFTYKISGGEIVGNKIKFNQRIVELKFISDDNSAGERAKSYTFWYVENDVIQASIVNSKIENNQIHLMAEETFTFEVEHVLPSDIKDLQFTIQNYSERRIDENKQVATFENGKLKALNGGEFSFTLYLNNKLIGTFTLIVTRPPTEIVIESENVYVSQPYYKISPSISPSDALQSDLAYECNSAGASVSENGEVTFTEFGVYEVKIYVKSNPSITKTITIKYTKELSAIEFNDTKTVMYVNDYVYLKVLPKPYDAEKFDYTMEADVEGVVSLSKTNDGSYLLRGLKSGKVTVTAKVVGKEEIQTSKEFVIIEQITDIKLELDKSNDVNGNGEYRYFGTHFLSADGNTSNQYKMKVTIKPESASLDLLEWESSCDEIATVDSDGVVTFLKAGKVTITVSQIKSYETAAVCKDSYEFTVVDGINVNNFEEFLMARELLVNDTDGWNKNLTDNFYAIVLHDDIVFKYISGIDNINYNLYGNGHLINLENINVNEIGYFAFIINRSNIILDNVTIRKHLLPSGSALSSLDGVGASLLISCSQNVLIYNTTFENADYHVQVYESNATFAGCVFRNALSSGIELKMEGSDIPSTVRVKDSIFTNILLCGIMYGFDNTTSPHKVILEDDVRFYNWATLDEIESGFKSKLSSFMKDFDIGLDVLNPLISQIKDIVAKQTNYCYTYGGKDYYHVGVLQASASLLGHEFKGYGTVERSDLNPTFNYSQITMNGSLNLGVTTASWEMKILSLTNTKPFIVPGQSSLSALPTIRQPNRF